LSRSYLVTGAAGFIGSHVSDALLARGDDVVGLDNLNPYYDPARKQANLKEVQSAGHPGTFEFVEGDIRDARLLSGLFAGNRFDSVVHLAAMAGVRASIEDPALYYDVNVMGTLNLLEAAVDMDPKPVFVFASTSSVYGDSTTFPLEENDRCDRPLVPYSSSKRAAEMMGHTFHNLYELDFTAVRFFTVYGPRGRPDMMAYKVADSAAGGAPVPLYNRGQMHRDWTYISDITSGVIAAADKRLGYEVINLGRGEPVLLADFVKLVEKELGAPADLTDAPMPQGDVTKTHAQIDKARDLLDYSPEISVEEGVHRFTEWYRVSAQTSDQR
jgi:UDP-glucuronate 4-epimerase